MPEGQLDIFLEEKQAAEASSCQVFFFFFFEVLHCQSARTRSREKKESCGTVILCCGKGEMCCKFS